MEAPALYAGKLVTAEEAIAQVRPGDTVFWGVFTEPSTLIQPFVDQRERLRGTIMVHETPLLRFPWFERDFGDAFRVYDCFPGANDRDGIASGQVEFVPLPFGLMTRDRAAVRDRRHLYVEPDVYVTRISEPDSDGYVSFGTFPWLAQELVPRARLVIGEIDPALPRTNARVSLTEIDLIVPPAPPATGPRRALPVTPPEELEAAQVIGAQAAELIQDGDTFQIGVGPSSEAMIEFLRARCDLGVHSELIFRTIVDLVREGVVTGARKNINRGKVVTAGLYLHPEDAEGPAAQRYIAEHPDLFEFRPISYVANVKTVAEHENIVAVNNILAIDLTGQAVINNLGTVPIAGIGGNFDFTVGAHYAKGGRALYCLISTAKGGTVSRVVPQIPHDPYLVVSMPRYMVDYLITEHGVVNLEGKSLRERAQAIISIAHPDFRHDLEAAARRLDLL
jgi:4-hydroxybutyrate CoA-transferase